MTAWVRRGLAAVLAVHAALHLLGAARGLGWAPVPQLSHDIGVLAGWAWLGAAAAVALAAVLVAVDARWWWASAALAAVASQAVIATAWQDARAGTAVNVLLVVAALLGYAAHGHRSFDAQWQDRAGSALALPHVPADLVREADLAALPLPLAAYLRRAGVVGQPRPHSLCASFHGRIRSGADQPWMPFTARQVSTFGPAPARLFLMHATRAALPVTVLHVFEGGHATMRGRLLSVVPILDAAGPEMDRGETVTVFDDMVLLAPAALLTAPVTWTTLSDSEVRGVFNGGTHTVSARLRFGARGELVDVVSDDRMRASGDGTSFSPQSWSTPVRSYGQLGDHRLVVEAAALWHAPAPEGTFCYAELTVDGVCYDPATTARAAAHTSAVEAVEAVGPADAAACSADRGPRQAGDALSASQKVRAHTR